MKNNLPEIILLLGSGHSDRNSMLSDDMQPTTRVLKSREQAFVWAYDSKSLLALFWNFSDTFKPSPTTSTFLNRVDILYSLSFVGFLFSLIFSASLKWPVSAHLIALDSSVTL